MKKFLTNLKEEAGGIRLTHAEKAAMKARIFGAPSPMHVEKSPYVFRSIFSYNTRMVLAGLMLFVLVGTGTASAAQGSLPGDLLYPVKISVNEAVEVALAQSASAKAEVEVKLAERRVEEAQTLAAEGRLDGEVATTLSANFDSHAQNAQDLSEGEKDEAIKAEVKTKLASSLAANGEVLRKIGKGSPNKDTKEQSDTFGARVIARAEGPSRAADTARAFAVAPMARNSKSGSTPNKGAQTMSFTATAQSGPSNAENVEAQRVAAHLQKKAAEALASVKELFRGTESLDATTTKKVEQQISSADESMSQGSVMLGADSYSEAQADFTEVLRLSTRLEALLKAEQKFDSGLLRSLLGGEVEGAQVEIISDDEASLLGPTGIQLEH